MHVQRSDEISQVLNGMKDIDLLSRTDIACTDHAVRANVAELNKCDAIVCKYKDVLNSSTECMPGEYDTTIDDIVAPVVHPPHSVPVTLRQQVKVKLDHRRNVALSQRSPN